MSREILAWERKRQHAVANLTALYTVVIGVALTNAVVGLVDPKDGIKSFNVTTACLFAAFLATLLPFFHGALRHLDDAYAEDTTHEIGGGAFVLDFLLLFLHAVAFAVLANLLKFSSEFGYVLGSLLFIDVLWGFFFMLRSPNKRWRAETKWLIINAVVVFGGALILWVYQIGLHAGKLEPEIAIGLVLVTTVRSLADYLWCWDFYFPRKPTST